MAGDERSNGCLEHLPASHAEGAVCRPGRAAVARAESPLAGMHLGVQY